MKTHQGDLPQPKPGKSSIAVLIWILIAVPLWHSVLPELLPGYVNLETSWSSNSWFVFWSFFILMEWFGFALCLTSMKKDNLPRAEVGLTTRHPTAWIIGVVVVLITFFAIIAARQKGIYSPPLQPAAQFPPVFQNLFFAATTPERVTLLLATITAAICEETMYRGFAFAGLKRLTRLTWLSALLPTCMFTLSHAYTHGGSRQLTGTFAVAVILMGLRLWRKTLSAPMFVHLLIDGFTLLATLPSRGVAATFSNIR